MNRFSLHIGGELFTVLISEFRDRDYIAASLDSDAKTIIVEGHERANASDLRKAVLGESIEALLLTRGIGLTSIHFSVRDLAFFISKNGDEIKSIIEEIEKGIGDGEHQLR